MASPTPPKVTGPSTPPCRCARVNMLGVQAPVGFWGPAGFTANCSSEDPARRRQTEIRHGRIAVLAPM
eukprot:14083237-Heterocapsa_arctica.AAC.1